MNGEDEMTAVIEQRSAGLARAFRGLALDRRQFQQAGLSMPTETDVRFFLMRHGESLGQITIHAYKVPGDAAIPLTDWGRRQSFEGGQFLRELAATGDFGTFEIFSSACLRTRETAECVAAGLGEDRVVSCSEDTRLNKQLFGLFSGIFDDREKARLYPNEFAEYQAQIAQNGLFHARPHGGESIADVQNKASDFVRSALKGGSLGKPRNIIAVTHGLIALCLENELLKHGESWVLRNVDCSENCNIRLIENRNGVFVAEEIGGGLPRPGLDTIHPAQTSGEQTLRL